SRRRPARARCRFGVHQRRDRRHRPVRAGRVAGRRDRGTDRGQRDRHGRPLPRSAHRAVPHEGGMSTITYPSASERAFSLRGRLAEIGWARPSFIGLLAITLLLYVWGLDRNGWANAYYSAAVQAGSQSWKAFLFGSLDSSNFITVDKSPAFLWVMDISARIFGVNTWSIQVPQALEGAATVALTYVMVRRWVGLVELWPAGSRPYVGGSQTNSVLELILGYNGLGRITGNENGSVVAAAAGGVSRWGATGWNRLFNTDFGGQVSWLIPAALILFAAAIVYTIAAPRTDIRRAAILLFGGWLLITGAVFSLAQGIIHPYYTIALAPPIGALAGAGGWMLWQRRTHLVSRGVMALAILATVVWADVLLDRSPTWHPELRAALLVFGLPAALLIVVAPLFWRRGLAVLAPIAVVVALAAPAAYTFETITTAHDVALPLAGPAVPGANAFG